MTSADFFNLCKMAWKRDAYTGFPRDMGKTRYPKAMTEGDQITYILGQGKKEDEAYMAFYSDDEQDSGTISRLFIDIDVKNHWDDMRLFVKSFWNSIDVFFSGGKGFHLYLYIKPTVYGGIPPQRDLLWENISTWCQAPIDKQTFLARGMKQLARISLTKHEGKPIKYKVPIHYNMTIDDVFAVAEHPEEYIDILYDIVTKPIIPLDWKIYTLSPKDFIFNHNVYI